jgi:hypothetical protein
VSRFETELFPIHVRSLSVGENFNVGVLSESVIEYATSGKTLWRSFGLKNTFMLSLLLLFILTANGFLSGGSHTTIRHTHTNNTHHTK